MNKYVIKNCPALRYDRTKFKVCYDRCSNLKCEDIDDCIPKKLIELCNDACNKAAMCNALESASVPVRDIFALFDTESELKGNKDA